MSLFCAPSSAPQPFCPPLVAPLQVSMPYGEGKCADTAGTVPVLWTGNAKILIYFSNKIYGSNFVKQHSETVMVWFEITKMPTAVTEKNIIVSFIIFFGPLSFPHFSVFCATLCARPHSLATDYANPSRGVGFAPSPAPSRRVEFKTWSISRKILIYGRGGCGCCWRRREWMAATTWLARLIWDASVRTTRIDASWPATRAANTCLL